MDTARQVIRWALPGWIALLSWTGFVTLNTLIHGQDQAMYHSILRTVGDLLLPLAATAIPVGFVIYQLYHWVYWFAPIPSLFGRRFIDPVDRGKEILDGVKDQVDFKRVFDNPLLEDAPDNAFEKRGRVYCKSARVMQLYRKNWHLSDSAWYLALSDERYKNTAEFLERRNRFLGDIYHCLGACYHAVTLAYVGYVYVFGRVSLIEAGEFLSGLTFLHPGATVTGRVVATTILTVLGALILRLTSFTLSSTAFLLGIRILRCGRIASFDALLALKHDVISNVMLDRPARVSTEVHTPGLE